MENDLVQTSQEGGPTPVPNYQSPTEARNLTERGGVGHLIRKAVAQERDYRVGASSVGVISRRRGETVITDVKTFRLIIIESRLLFAPTLGQVLSGDSSIYITSILRSVDDLPTNASQKADLLLVDIDEYCLDIAGLLASCKQRVPGTHVCALSSFVRPGADAAVPGRRSRRVHHQGHLGERVDLRDQGPGERLAIRGSPGCGRRLAPPGDEPGSLAQRAVSREVEIVRLIAQGMSNREIGAQLSCPRRPSRTTSAGSRETEDPGAHRRGRYAIRTGLA